jgi:hypothetical protein
VNLRRRTGEDLTGIVRDSLSDGNALSKRVLAVTDFRLGTSVTFVPDATCPLTLGQGGVIETVDAAREHMQRLVAEVENLPFTIVVGENRTAQSTDEMLVAQIPNSYSTVGEDIYEWGANPEDLAGFLNGVSDLWLTNCFLLTGVTTLPPKLTPAELEDLADLVKGIVVGAFDAEGYILWKTTPLA